MEGIKDKLHKASVEVINILKTGWQKFNGLSLGVKIGSVVALFLFLIFFGVFTFYQAVRFGAFGSIPEKGELSKISNLQASEVYTEDGTLIGKYYIQERTTTAYENISPHIIEALIATEDARFYEHDGVDNRSMLRVLFKSILLGDESAGGGSTISQQLAKNIFPRENHGILTMPVNKIREAIIAQRLEEIYSKKEILTLYLNTVSFGDNAFGIETAAERFFNKSAASLSVEEAAVLVGMLKATTDYNPRLYPEKSFERRNVVFNQMEKYGYLTALEADSLQKIPIKLDYKKLNHNEGLATYFREHLRKELEAWCKNNKKSNGEPYNLYTDGLKITTTLNSRLQAYAEDAVAAHMKDLQEEFFNHWKGKAPWGSNSRILLEAVQRSKRYKRLKAEGLSEEEIQEDFSKPVKMKVFSWNGEEEKTMSPLDSVKYYLYFLNTGFLAMDPQSGEVKAWVGGINHKYFKYDHVNKNTKRQVGSTFKPLVYVAALEQGAYPCTYIPASRETYPELDNWSPGNSDGKYDGEYTFQGALTNSVNTVSVKILKRTGLKATIEVAKKMGIENEIPNVPSIALGTPELSLYEMVRSYCTFVNRGETVNPTYLIKIEDKNGKLLQNFTTNKNTVQAITPDNADRMVQMLKGVVNEGTASRLRWKYKLNNEISGKTGTTQSHADGWFIGMTPKLVVGVWVGADNPGIRFRTTNLGQGAHTALPIFAQFFQRVNKDPQFKHIANAKFPTPNGDVLASLDCEPYRDPFEFNVFEKLFGTKEETKESKIYQEKRRGNSPSTPRNGNGKKKKKSFLDKLFGGY